MLTVTTQIYTYFTTNTHSLASHCLHSETCPVSQSWLWAESMLELGLFYPFVSGSNSVGRKQWRFQARPGPWHTNFLLSQKKARSWNSPQIRQTSQKQESTTCSGIFLHFKQPDCTYQKKKKLNLLLELFQYRWKISKWWLITFVMLCNGNSGVMAWYSQHCFVVLSIAHIIVTLV